MRYCSKCGNPIPDGAGFCSQCGTPVPQAAPAAGPAKPVFCRACGARMPASAAACPNCGTPVAAPPARPAAKAAPAKAAAAAGGKSALPFIIGGAAVVVVAVVAVLIWVLVGRSHAGPAQQFVSYQSDLVSGVLTPVESAGETVKKGIKNDVTITASVDDPDLATYLNGSSITMKVDASSDKALINEQLTLMGSSVLNATITYEDGKLGFYLPELDQNYYVIDLDQLLGEALDVRPYSYSSDTVNALFLLNLLSKGSDRLPDLIQPYLDILLTLVNDQSVTRQDNVPVTLTNAGQQVNCTVYTFTPRGEDIEKALIALADRLEHDDALRSLILDSYMEALSYSTMPGFDEDAYRANLEQTFAQGAESIRGDASSIAQSVQAMNIVCTLAVEGDQIRQINLAFADTSGYATSGQAYESTSTNGLVYESADVNGQSCQWLTAMDGGWAEPIFANTYLDSNGRRSGTFTLYIDSEPCSVNYDIQPDKKSPIGVPYGTYSLYIPDTPVSLSLSVGDGANGGSDHVITLSGSRDFFGDLFSTLSMTVNVTDGTSAVWPSAPVVDISDYTPDQLETLVMTLVDAFQQDVSSNLGALMSNDW